MNGVQCCFESTTSTPPHVMKSPLFTSDHDAPTAHTLELSADDCVVSVTARTGALVDSMEIVTARGLRLKAGGSGGGDVCKVSWRL